MKKTFPVNINGTVYYIDDDAYELLNNYLEQLRVAFPAQEGKEIVADIEARISEIFSEICHDKSKVINIADVNAIIETMGRPAEISDFKPDSANDENPEGNESGATPPPYNGSKASNAQDNGHTPKRLFRNMQNKILGGVLSGLAIYLNWNPTILRVLVVILALTTQIFPLFFCYLIAWMVIPAATTMRQILEMRGEPVTIDSVSQSILDKISVEPTSTTSALGKVISVIFKIFLVLMAIVGVCIGLGALFVLIISLSGLIMFAGWGTDSLIGSMHLFDYNGYHPYIYTIGILCATLAVLIPCVAAVWGCIRAFNGRDRASGSTIITIAVVELVLIIAAIILLNLCTVPEISAQINTLAPFTSIFTSVCSIYMA